MILGTPLKQFTVTVTDEEIRSFPILRQTPLSNDAGQWCDIHVDCSRSGRQLWRTGFCIRSDNGSQFPVGSTTVTFQPWTTLGTLRFHFRDYGRGQRHLDSPDERHPGVYRCWSLFGGCNRSDPAATDNCEVIAGQAFVGHDLRFGLDVDLKPWMTGNTTTMTFNVMWDNNTTITTAAATWK